MTLPSNETRNGLKAGGLALIAAATLSACSTGLQDLPVGGAGRDSFDVTAELITADGVVAGADVRHGQQIVGRVTDIALRGGHAEVTLTLSDGTELPANVAASVELPSALGTPFIRLTAPEGATGELTEGSHIDLDHTSVGPQVESTLAALGNLVGGSGVSQLESVMSSLNSAFTEERAEKVGPLIDTLNRLLAKTSTYNDDFNAAMSAAADVSEMLAGQQQLVSDFLDQVPAAVDVLASQRDKIAGLMSQTTTLATNMDAIVTGRRPELNALVSDAETVISSLSQFNDNVGETLGSMNAFMTNMGRAIRGDYLVFDGALDIPGGIDKILTGGLLLSGQPLPSPQDLADALTGGLASAAKKKAAEKKSAEKKSAEKKSAEKKSADKKPAEKKAAPQSEEGQR